MLGRGGRERRGEHGLALGTHIGCRGIQHPLRNVGMYLGYGGAVVDGLLAHRFGTHLRAGLMLELVRGVGKGDLRADHGGVLHEGGSYIGASEGRKEGSGGTKAMVTGGTALAQHRDLDPPEARQDYPAGGPIGMQRGMGTGRTLVYLGLRRQCGLAQRLTHGPAARVKNLRFHGVHIGSCRDTDRQRYCDAHEKSSW